MDAESLEHIVPDGGYGWVIVLVAFMSIGISSIFSLDPFFTYLIDRFSHKPLMITILFAISNIIASFARRGLANGIAIAGGVGPLIYSPILSKLLSSIGHQWTISVFVLLIWTFSTTLVPLLIFAMIYGMNAGGFVSLLSVVATDIVGYDQITNSIGYLYAIDIIGTTFGTPIAGALLDLSKSKATNQEGVEIYFLPIMYSGSIIIFGTFFLIISWAKLSSSPSLIETACCIVILILTLLDLA
ncbi:4426_t:CDS:2 [Entrophospora sp. SA101]|nr:4426_t:CDS:2 [Entrophospora sp. SA101]